MCQTAHDQRTLEGGTRPIYDLDFGVLCEYFYGSHADGSKPFYQGNSNWLTKVINDASRPFTLTVSPPTYLEFLDQTIHHLDDAEILSQNLDKMRDLKLEDYLSESFSTMRDKVFRLTSSSIQDPLMRPLNRLENCIKSKLLVPVTDVSPLPTPNDVARFQAMFLSVYDQQRQRRLKFDEGRRPVPDSEFHYRIDAANICLTRILGDVYKCERPFVTPSATVYQDCNWKNHHLGRMERIPQYMWAIHNLQRTGNLSGSSQDYLIEGVTFGKRLINDLKRCRSNKRLPSTVVDKLVHFYSSYVGNLDPHGGSSCDRSKEDDYELMRDRLSSPGDFKDELNDAVSRVKERAKSLSEEYANGLQAEFISHFDLEDDPIYQKICDTFQLK